MQLHKPERLQQPCLPAFCLSDPLLPPQCPQVEGWQDSDDDTAANAVRARCTDGTELLPGEGPWGSWGPWATCPQGYAVHALKLKVEPSQGDGDDTAMNSMAVTCCSLTAKKDCKLYIDDSIPFGERR